MVFPLTKTLVKSPAKNLVKNLAKNPGQRGAKNFGIDDKKIFRGAHPKCFLILLPQYLKQKQQKNGVTVQDRSRLDRVDCLAVYTGAQQKTKKSVFTVSRAINL